MLDFEPIIRLGAFAIIFALAAGLEALFPRRQQRLDRMVRWPGNFTILLINTVFLRFLLPVTAVGFALMMEARDIGLFHHVDANSTVEIIASLILLDLAIYVQHVIFHHLPILWRIHRVHHTDRDMDCTTAIRFHPVEIYLSMFFKFAVIGHIGAPAIAVLLFELFLNTGAMFNHANLRLPESLDRILRLFVVTPDMHRVHHSVIPAETNSNFGFNLSCWDRFFGTYIPQPMSGHTNMTLGVAEFRAPDEQSIWRMLLQPLAKPVDAAKKKAPKT